MITQQIFWVICMVYTFITVYGNTRLPAFYPNEEWWSNSIIYQVYPRSFKDSNKDGIGDLNGITEKLDYFVELGIDILWIGPIFKSPMDDMGYDVEDYYTIDPIFGTMDDFTKLITEMNKRNLKLITDIVPNHSSYKCKWFQKSIKQQGKYKDYYIWRDAKNQKEVIRNSSVTPIVPNNWLSVFGGTAWTWHTDRKQFYYHQFNPQQPDYNIRNPDVQKEIYDILEFWLDRGITGFRFDALKHLFEDDKFLDEQFYPGKEKSLNHDDMIHSYTCDQSENLYMIYAWREFMENYNIRKNSTLTKLISTESYSPVKEIMKYYGNETSPGAQIPFNFELMGYDKNHMVDKIDYATRLWLDHMPKNAIPNWVLENHDNQRIATRYGPEMVQVFTALKLALPGIDVTYYGGEIGMENVFVRIDQLQDPNNAGGKRADESRDFERSPMQWNDSINAGFTEASKPWLPVNPNYYKLNVETQKQIPTSNYNFYKKMVQLRKTGTLKYGDLQTYNISKSIYILKRSLPRHETYIVVLNVGSETETIDLSKFIHNLTDKLYVYLGSANSAYNQGNTISTNSAGCNPLQLRPESVVILTDEIKKANYQTSSKNSSNSNSTKIISKLIILLCVFFCIRYYV